MRLAFAGCEIDLDRRELSNAGQKVHLEPQVFDLLAHLVRNRDRVVSRDELFETVWQGRIVSDTALSSRINAARRAVGDDGERQAVIRTIHKRGFRFMAEVVEAGVAPSEMPRPAPPPRARSAARGPLVAVLPFTHLGEEPGTEHFATGLTEDVIRLLAQYRWMAVLGQHSTAAFGVTPADARDFLAGLGVDYIVRGSVAKRGARVRITADLLAGGTWRQLWSESYDVVLADIFAIQVTMAQQIAAVIEPELARLERKAAVERPAHEVDAWDCYQRGMWHLWTFTLDGLHAAEALFRRAIALDPGFARAHGLLAYVLLQRAVLGEAADRPALLTEALDLGRAGLALDDQDSATLCALGRVLAFMRRPDEAIALIERAIDLNPSFAQPYFALGVALLVAGRAEEALAHLERAVELSPRDPHLASFHTMHALAHLALGEPEAAAASARRAAVLPNATHWPFALLAAALGLAGRGAEAAAALGELSRRRPGYTPDSLRSDLFFCPDATLVARCVDGLGRAIAAEGAPLRLERASGTRP